MRKHVREDRGTSGVGVGVVGIEEHPGPALE